MANVLCASSFNDRSSITICEEYPSSKTPTEAHSQFGKISVIPERVVESIFQIPNYQRILQMITELF